MTKKVKSFNIVLTTITHIHIGSGLQYFPVDYTIGDDCINIIDKDKLMEAVNANEYKYKEFIRLCEQFQINDKNNNLVRLVRDLGEGKYKYSVKLTKDASEYIKKGPYELSRAPIERFVRNPLDDTPYIPGSSIKGAIRTAIIEVLFRKILKDKENNEERCLDNTLRGDILTRLNKNCDNILHDSNGNDIAHYISVSDFYPADTVSMEICKPKNKKRNIETQDKGIPVLLECVKPNYSSFKGTVTIDERFFDEFNNILKDNKAPEETLVDKSKFDKSVFASWIRGHYIDRVYDCEKSKIYEYNLDIQQKALRDSDSFIMKIGKHGGAVSKTISGIRKIKVQKQTKPHQTTLWFVDDKPIGWVKGHFV